MFSTDVNSLFLTKAYLGYASAAKARLVRRESLRALVSAVWSFERGLRGRRLELVPRLVSSPRRSRPTAGAAQVLKKPHPLYGLVAGKPSYAIRRISLLAPRLATIVEPCASAAESTDARDKYFLSSAERQGAAVQR